MQFDKNKLYQTTCDSEYEPKTTSCKFTVRHARSIINGKLYDTKKVEGYLHRRK